MLTAQLSEINGLTECERFGSGASQTTVPMLEVSMCRLMLFLGSCRPFSQIPKGMQHCSSNFSRCKNPDFCYFFILTVFTKLTYFTGPRSWVEIRIFQCKSHKEMLSPQSNVVIYLCYRYMTK